MYFKRPSFKKGGQTGIGQLTPRVNAATGFPNFGVTYTSDTPSSYDNFMQKLRTERALKKGETVPPTMGFRKSKGLLDLIKGERYTNPDYVSPFMNPDAPFFSTNTGFRFLTPGGVKKETIFATEDGPMVFGSNKNPDYYNDLENEFLGLDESEIKSKGAGGDQITILSEKEKEATTEALLKSIEEKKKKVEPGSDESSITLDPYEEIKKEKDFLSEMLKNEGLERGEIALIAAKAIGTEGTFKDKLDAAVELALPVVRRRNKEDKALTLTAYKAFKEKEAAKAKAGQDTTGIKDLKYQANILKQSSDPQYKDKSTEEIISIIIKDKFADADSQTRTKILSSTNVAGEVSSRFDDLRDAKSQLDNYIEKKGDKLKADDKKLVLLRKTLEEAKVNFNLFAKYPEFEEIYPTFVTAITSLGLKEGGRVKRALGTPPTGEQVITTEAQTIGAETAEKPVLKLNYNQLRDRLPPEITDDVVQLLANSEEALQEFAYIQTQNDVNAFNLKYGVNLIIPPAPQTA